MEYKRYAGTPLEVAVEPVEITPQNHADGGDGDGPQNGGGESLETGREKSGGDEAEEGEGKLREQEHGNAFGKECRG
jgi:hypothetical protein